MTLEARGGERKCSRRNGKDSICRRRNHTLDICDGDGDSANAIMTFLSIPFGE
jgi:hypothetical protein